MRRGSIAAAATEPEETSKPSSSAELYANLVIKKLRDRCDILQKVPGVNSIFIRPFTEGPDGLCTLAGLSLEQFHAVFLIVKLSGARNTWGITTKPQGDDGRGSTFALLSNPGSFQASMNLLIQNGSIGNAPYWRMMRHAADKVADRPQAYKAEDLRPFTASLDDSEYNKLSQYISTCYDNDGLVELIRLAPQMGVNVHISATETKLHHIECEIVNPFVLKTVSEKNGKETHYWRVPRTSTTGMNATANLLQNIPNEHFKELLNLIDRDGVLLREEKLTQNEIDQRNESIRRTAPLFTHLLVSRYKNDVLPVMKKFSSTQRIDILDTLALQQACDLSIRRLNHLRRFLRSNNIILAGKGSCQKYLNSLDLPKMDFDDLKNVPKKIEHSIVQPLEALDHLLNKFKRQGECLTGLSDKLAVNLQLDKGGGETKFIMQVGSPTILGQYNPFLIGKYKGDDDYEHLRAFLLPFREGLWGIRRAIVMEFSIGDKWDYVVIDSKDHPLSVQRASNTTGRSSGSRSQSARLGNTVLPNGITSGYDKEGKIVILKNGEVIKTLDLHEQDIDVRNGVEVKFIKLGMFLSADLQAHCNMLGMRNAEGHYCIHCNASKSEMQIGTCASFVKVSLATLQQRARDKQPIARGSTIMQLEPLFDMIEVEDRIVMLHLRLGMASSAHQKLYDFILRFDIANNVTLQAANARVEVLTAEVSTAQEALQDAMRVARETAPVLAPSSSSSAVRPKSGALYAAHVRKEKCIAKVEALRVSISETGKRMKGQYDYQHNENVQNKLDNLQNMLVIGDRDLGAANAGFVQARAAHMLHFPYLVVQGDYDFTPEEVQACRESAERIANSNAAHNLALAAEQSARTNCMQAEERLKLHVSAYHGLLLLEKKNGTLLGDATHHLERILLRHGIASAVWFGGTSALQGRSTFNLFRKAESYMEEIHTMLLSRNPVNGNEHEKAVYARNMHEWNVMRPGFIKLMHNADVIFSITESVKLMTEEDKDKMQAAQKTFLECWKEVRWPITPKCHFTTVHLGDEAIRTQVYGIFSESTIERMHFLCNLIRNRTHNAKTSQEREIRQYRLLEVFFSPEISDRVLAITSGGAKAKKCMKRASNEEYQKSVLVNIEQKVAPSVLGKRSFVFVSNA